MSNDQEQTVLAGLGGALDLGKSNEEIETIIKIGISAEEITKYTQEIMQRTTKPAVFPEDIEKIKALFFELVKHLSDAKKMAKKELEKSSIAKEKKEE